MFNSAAYRYINGELHEAFLECNITLNELMTVSDKVLLAESNIKAFLSDNIALNMLFWGEKGSGKSTLLRLLALKYACKGLVTIEYLDENHTNIYKLYKEFRKYTNKKFIIFFDDISFSDSDVHYKRFKSIIDGGLEEKPNNVIFVATSNKRHLISDKVSDTSDIYDRDEINEKTSLHTRFGISIGFYNLNKENYLNICKMYLNKYNVFCYKDWQKDAESYAIDRGGRSGRLAKQFATFCAINQNIKNNVKGYENE